MPVSQELKGKGYPGEWAQACPLSESPGWRLSLLIPMRVTDCLCGCQGRVDAGLVSAFMAAAEG
ncbi:hypothetical protein JCM7447_17170 [Corynebacterium amycolatum]